MTSYMFQASCLIGGSTNFPAYGDFMSAHVTRTYGKWWLKGEDEDDGEAGNGSMDIGCCAC